MASSSLKKHIAHKGSGHGCVSPPAASLVSPPAPPAPAPFPYAARASNASKTSSKMKVGKKNVLVEGSTMSLDPPANQPAQPTGGDVVTHATKNIAVMTMGSMCLLSDGKGVCATGDIAAMNVITAQSKVAQMSVPLLEAGDFEMARKSGAAAAAMNEKYKKAFPPPKASQTTAGHPVDLGTGYVVDAATDLTLPGYVPLVWARSYASSFAGRRGALGKGGWSHSFEQWIEPTETGLRLHDEEGLPVDFAMPPAGGASFHRGRQLELRTDGHAVQVRSLRDRRTRTFSRLPGGRMALRSIRDARGHAIELRYDGDRLAQIDDSVGRELRIASDASGRVTRVEVWARPPGPEGAPADTPLTLQTWFDYGYHPEGELAHHTNALGHAEGWDYDGLHRMVRAGTLGGLSFHYEYDPEEGYCVHTWGDGGVHDVRIEIDFEAGETRTHGTNRARRYLWKNGIVFREETFGGDWAVERRRDDDDLLVARIDGAGNQTSWEYDARGHMVRQIDAAGNVETYVFEDDLPVEYVDPAGNSTRHGFDASGALVAIDGPTGDRWVIERDREGRVAAIADATGTRRRFGYDDQANLVEETTGRRARTVTRHDALGRIVESTDALGRTSRVDYDLLGHIVRWSRPDGTVTEATWDRQGNIATHTDPLGRVSRFEHVGTGIIGRVTLANGQMVRFVYDSDERLVRIVNQRLETFELTWDRADQVVGEKTFDGRSLSYRYDLAGRVVRSDEPDDEWRELAYDALGNVIENRGPDVQLTFERDERGRLVKAVCQDVTGKVVTEHVHDRFGRLVRDVQNGRAIAYTHDARGRVVGRTLPDGEHTEYRYDEEDAFSGLTHDGARLDVDRDLLGRESRRRGPGWALTRELDVCDRLIAQHAQPWRHGEPAGAPVIERRFGYDARGRLTTMTSPAGPTHFEYDAIDQLVSVARRTSREIFEYDPAGSLVQRLEELGERRRAWSVGPGNVLREADGVRYVNDGSRRRIQRIEPRPGEGERVDGPVTTYGWDTLDRLREVALPDGTRVRFTYDALGRRVRKDVLPPADAAAIILGTQPPVRKRSVTFLWDELTLVEEIDSGRPEARQKRVHVLQPRTFLPLLQVEGGRTYGVVTDHNGLVKELVDEQGQVAWRAEHGGWGNVLEVRRDPGTEVESPFRMLGHYADPETDLTHTMYRYFEARTGRWLSPDPVGLLGGMNLSAFNAAPTLRVDPLGLCAQELQKLVNEAYAKLIDDPDAVRDALRPKELAALDRKPWLVRCFFGTAMEREVDDLVANNPLMQQHGVTGQSGGGPDYAGGGMTFELTTSNPNTVTTHAHRGNAAQDGMVTYPPLPAGWPN